MARNAGTAGLWIMALATTGLTSACVGQIGGEASGGVTSGNPPPTSGAASSTGSGITGAAGNGGGSSADTGLPCDVQSVLATRCWSCHAAGTAGPGQPVLVTRDNLMATSALDPALTYAQAAVARMQSTSAPMPPAPAAPATAQEIATLNGWIAAGYPAGSCGGADGGAGSGPDPFSVAPTCTSKKNWTGGNDGQATMNPGMACISCHKSSGGEAPVFAIAGTVYPTAHEPDLCYGANGTSGAQIVVIGADGTTQTLAPNSAGNFSSSSSIKLPYQAKVVYMGRERAMVATQTTGDCNSCHTQSGANGAPGRILLP